MSWDRASLWCRNVGMVVGGLFGVVLLLLLSTYLPGMGNTVVTNHDDMLTVVPTPAEYANILDDEDLVVSARADSFIVMDGAADFIRQQFTENGSWPEIHFVKRSVTDYSTIFGDFGASWRQSWVDEIIVGNTPIRTRLYRA